MDRVTAASSMCQLSLHALHTEGATAAAVRNRANSAAAYTKEKAKHGGELLCSLC